MKRVSGIALLGCLLAASAARAACPTTTDTFKNAGGTTNTLCIGGTSGTAEVFQHQILDSASTYAFPAVSALSDTLANPTEWTIGANLLGWDATNSVWRRVALQAQASTTSGQTGSLVMGAATTIAPAYTTAQTDPISLDTFGNTRVLNDGGCAGQSINNTNVAVINLASTTATKLVSKVAAKKVYICQVNLITATAQNIALIEGTQTTNQCDTSTAGLAGGTTAATGWNLAVNGGLTVGNGQGIVIKSGTANFDVCIVSSSTGQVSGTVTWAQF